MNTLIRPHKVSWFLSFETFCDRQSFFNCFGNQIYTVLAECNVPYDRLKTICAQMTKATNEFRRCITEVKEAHARQIERLQRERDAALMAARVHADVDDPNSHHHMPGVEIPTTKKVRNAHELDQDGKILA